MKISVLQVCFLLSALFLARTSEAASGRPINGFPAGASRSNSMVQSSRPFFRQGSSFRTTEFAVGLDRPGTGRTVGAAGVRSLPPFVARENGVGQRFGLGRPNRSDRRRFPADFLRDHRRRFFFTPALFVFWPFDWCTPTSLGPGYADTSIYPTTQVAPENDAQTQGSDSGGTAVGELLQAMVNQRRIDAAIVSQLAKLANVDQSQEQRQASPSNPEGRLTRVTPPSEPAPTRSETSGSSTLPPVGAGKNIDNLVLLSWLNIDSQYVVYVQNTQTHAVQKITTQPDPNNLRVIAMHPDSDPRFTEAVISDGTDQVSVKFQQEAP
jgi:hypothetical protein